jgi:periplasmic protein TonB
VAFSPTSQYRVVQGWVVSTLVHGLALTVILAIMAQVKPAIPKDVFTWDVALVEPQKLQDTHQADIAPTQKSAQATPRPIAPIFPQPKMAMHKVQTHEVTPVVQGEISQVIETREPMQQMVAVQTRTEEVMPVREQQVEEVQQTHQPVVESVAPLVQHEAVTAESAVTPSPATVAATDTKPTESVVTESASHVAMATRPIPAVKADNSWLVESLRRRLTELKRYPSTARLKGWEGKVVLRAVIRADGHLSEVKVHRSSGHESLDNAAMETLRLACPLHLQQPISTSELAIYVPIVYSLAS